MSCKYLETNWVKDMTDALVLLHPDMTRDEIEDFVIEEYHANYKEHDCAIYNSYENTVANTTLGGVIDWIQVDKPLIAESGVFFYPKDKKRNINVEIIKERMLDARTVHKKEMFEALDAGDTFTATVKNIQQLNDKKAANSGYGAEGQRSSFLYNVHSAMSVTACGRGQLSTAMMCYENLFGDFVKFFNMDEFYAFITNIIREEHEWQFDTARIIEYVPPKKMWIKRFKSKFLHSSLYDEEMIEQTYDSLSDEMRMRTYYKANIREFFLRNSVPTRMLDVIIHTDVEFIDPNKPPKEIKGKLDYLTELVMEFVGYKYSTFRYEDRARYQKRAVVCVMDTDSNMLNYGPLLDFMRDKVLPPVIFSKKNKYAMQIREDLDLKILNVLSTFASAGIASTLWNYLGYVHVAEEDRKYIKMKNEFFYSRIIVTFAKKSYIALLKRREGSVLKKPKLDVKGVNFFKSTASKETSDFIYKEILMDQLLQPKDGKISLSRTFRAVHDFQEHIGDEIAAGNMGFMKRSVKVKSPDAYANPMGIGQYKAVYVWNQIMPETEHIQLPAITTNVKVKLQNKKDVAALAPWPKIYEKVMWLFDNEPEIGDHIEIKDGKEKLVKGKGIKSIAVPNEYDELPDWMLAIIDVETLVNSNMLLFQQLFLALGMSPGTVSHRGTTMKYFTNLVRL